VSFLRGVATTFAQARPGFVLLAVALHLAGLLVTGARWRAVAAALGGRISLVKATLVNLAGIFVRNVTPTTGLGGDAARIALLRSEAMPLPEATATFVYVRAAEIPALAAVVLMALPRLGGAIARVSGRLEAEAIVVAVAAIGIGLGRRRIVGGLARLRAWHRRLRIAAPVWLSAIAYATLAQLETLVRQIVIAAAFGVPLTLTQSAAVTALGVVGGLVPTVGGVGTIDGGIVAALLLCGVPANAAVAITVAERAISFGLSTALGAAALGGLGGRAVLRTIAAPPADPACVS
jgi:glycosyltransferase 2 family protein